MRNEFGSGFNSMPEVPLGGPGVSSKKEKDSKTKTKKKSGAELAPVPPGEAKKAQAAERTKSLLDKLVVPKELSAEAKPAGGLPKADGEKQAGSPVSSEKPAATAPEQTGEKPTEQPVTTEVAEAKHAHEAAEDDEDEDAEKAIEELSGAEQAEVLAAYAPARIAELKAGRSETEEPADAAAREADIAYLETVMAAPETVTVETSAETVDAAEEPEDFELAEPAAEAVDRSFPEDEAREFDEDEAVPLSGGASGSSGAGGSRGPRAGSGSTPGSGGSGGGSSGSGSGGSGGGRGIPYPPHPAMHTGGVGPGAGAGQFNALPTAATRTEYVPDYRQNPNATYLLVGGIVGYFIGRRRGRIKTEKRMRVVQKKLEKQVADIQHQVAQKEAVVQQQAREQYWQRQREAQALRDTAPRSTAPGTNPLLRAAEAAVAVPLALYTAERTAPQAERLGRLGRSELERPAPSPTSETPQQPSREAVRPPGRAESVKLRTLTKEQVLESSAKIKIGNTNLKRIYEARLISDTGLQRLVYEHLEGHDIRRGLAREFLAKELSYERDPRFRDLLPPEAAGRVGSGHSSGAARLDGQPVAGAPANEEQSAQAAKSTDEKQTQKDKQDKQNRQVSNGLLAALTLIALGLAAYAVLLSLTR